MYHDLMNHGFITPANLCFILGRQLAAREDLKILITTGDIFDFE